MTTYSNVYRQLHGQILGETAKAIKFSIYCSERKSDRIEWFPLSQVQSVHRLYDAAKEQQDILMVSEWILKQKGWMDYAVTGKPVLPGVPTTEIPKIQDKLQHPPTSAWSDMDDDIPF